MDAQLKIVIAVLESLAESAANISPFPFRINKSNRGKACSKFVLNIDRSSYEKYLGELASNYIGDRGVARLVDEYDGVSKYKGGMLEDKLVWLPCDSKLIAETWTAFVNSGEPCGEIEWVKNLKRARRVPKGLALEGLIGKDDVSIIMATSPIKIAKQNMFSFIDDSFKLIDGPILTLPLRIDALRISDRIYFFTKVGLNLFLSQAVIDEKAEKDLRGMVASGAITDKDEFMRMGQRGYNRRRLLSFNEESFMTVIDEKAGKDVRDKFGVGLVNGKLIFHTQDDVDRLIKVITDRGMVHPFSNKAMEVSSALEWKFA